MSDRYQEIRGILEDLVHTWPGDGHAALRRAQDHLQTHCELCGRALVGAGRADQGASCCDVCSARRQAELEAAVAAGRAAAGKRRVSKPASKPAPTPIMLPPGELLPPALQRWPEAYQGAVFKHWHEFRVQRLVAELESLGVVLPVIRWPHQPSIRATRAEFLSRPEVREALRQANAAGVSVRFMAALLFASQPGAASDAISKAMRPDGFFPEHVPAAANPR